MGKKKTEAAAIEAGRSVTVTAASRQEAKEKLDALRKQAEALGLVQDAGGFIEYRDGDFSAVITFIEK